MFLGKIFKRKNLALVLGIFMFLSAAGISQAEDIKVRVRVRRANIREKPSLRSEIVAQVRRGRILQVDRKEGEWYRVRLPLKLEGYSLPGYIHQSIVKTSGLFTFNGTIEDREIEGINLNSLMLGVGFKYFF